MGESILMIVEVAIYGMYDAFNKFFPVKKYKNDF
jgi:hypothetical protein